MADFDAIRDKTLLFFLDHLMEKGQPRSLHDLSCQFGAKVAKIFKIKVLI